MEERRVGREIELLVNPAAGGGRAGRMLGEFTRELSRVGFAATVHRTAGRGALVDLARALVRDGAPLVGVMGGDGTFHDAVGSILGPDGATLDARRTTFASIPAGTGGDLAARTLGIPKTPSAIADWLARANPTPFDLGRLEYTTHAGAPAVTLFTNIASCGMSGRVDELVATGPKWITGKAAYFVASTRALVGWKHKPVRVEIDGNTLYEGRILTAAVANGRAFGGGMMIADPGDGELDVVILGDLPVMELASVSRTLYDGSHVGSKNVHTGRGRVVKITPMEASPVLLDVDGETPGRLPGTFSVLPGAVSLLRA
jgi:diacylglycerol kinase family enzyme